MPCKCNRGAGISQITGDREDAPPLQLPIITSPKRIVLVRHGQSTWNAEGRVQGSSNFSYLTKRGQAQADTTRVLLEKEKFDMLIHSPLQRAKETAEIVWNAREGPVKVLPSLREIDLYSFQGLIKQQGKDRYGEQYRMWQKQAAEFMIDGRAPVRELWHRASLAWQQTLNIQGMRCALVVAHNAVNQAMIATATGLPPSYFRRLLQSNGATTSPGPPFTPEDSSVPKPTARIVMIRHGATYSTEDGLLLGRKDEALTPLGEVQANKTAELLMDMKIDTLFSSPLKRSADTARTISKLQSLTGFGVTPFVQQKEELTERDFGEWEGEPTARLRSEALSDNTKGGEPLSSLWERVLRAWKQVLEAAQAQGGQTVAVVGHSGVIAAMLCMCLGLGQDRVSMFRSDCGGMTIIEFPFGDVSEQNGSIRCINYTAHLGRWAIPVTRENLEDMDWFTVPGDFNLLLLDQLLAEPKLNMINTCNELNAGYAADGYARAKGVGCCVVTFTVGGLSVINAIAGAYSEDLPVICVVGGPNSNDFGTTRILHHTIGETDFMQEFRCFREVTCDQVIIQNVEQGHALIDRAVANAMRQSKPVYISICCNLAGLSHPTFETPTVPFSLFPRLSNPQSLRAAVKEAAGFLNKATRPVMVAGVKVRWPCKAQEQFMEVAEASEYPVAVMPNAKSFFPETHPRFIGSYWGQVSTPFTVEIVEASDAYIFAGAVQNDYSSVGYSLLLKQEKMVDIQDFRVTVAGKATFGCVLMSDFLHELAKELKPNSQAFDNYQRMYMPSPEVPAQEPGTPLRTKNLFKHVQGMLTSQSAVITETGDAWFNGQKLKLPEGCMYDFQMQYGSIGWSVGALLGYSAALRGKKRVIACIGDGSFQVTAQDISTVMRYKLNPVVFLLNNASYTIEVQIHDGPYNYIPVWSYAKVVSAMDNGAGNVFTTVVKTEEELQEAIHAAETEHEDKLCFLEVIIDKNDTSKELLEWGSRVAAANNRPPNPQ
eukprot:jgi/Astpho2/7803/Aster-06094